MLNRPKSKYSLKATSVASVQLPSHWVNKNKKLIELQIYEKYSENKFKIN